MDFFGEAHGIRALPFLGQDCLFYRIDSEFQFFVFPFHPLQKLLQPFHFIMIFLCRLLSVALLMPQDLLLLFQGSVDFLQHPGKFDESIVFPIIAFFLRLPGADCLARFQAADITGSACPIHSSEQTLLIPTQPFLFLLPVFRIDKLLIERTLAFFPQYGYVLFQAPDCPFRVFELTFNTAPARIAAYQPALELAELILKGRSFEQRVGGLLVTGYLFNMAKVFEDFVTVALREALKPYGGRSRLQYATHLDEDANLPIRPDFVWLEEGRPRIVADAKYKAEKPSGFPQADLYQMLAYCTVLGLPEGHLVYAKGEDGCAHVVRRAGVRIVTHALDLDVEPVKLLATVAELVEILVSSTEREPAFSGRLHG